MVSRPTAIARPARQHSASYTTLTFSPLAARTPGRCRGEIASRLLEEVTSGLRPRCRLRRLTDDYDIALIGLSRGISDRRSDRLVDDFKVLPRSVYCA